jgi:hypothetical protein
MLNNINLDEITEEELEAHTELKEYADAIKKRQQKFQLGDVAQNIVDNKMLINEIDDILGQRHTADDGKKYSQLPTSISVPSLNQDASHSTIPGNLNNASSQEYLGDVDASMDDLAINRLYYEMVDPHQPTNLKPKKSSLKTTSKQKKFNPK